MQIDNHTLNSLEKISEFPLFQRLPFKQIYVLNDRHSCLAIEKQLKNISIFGFDTESKPTFRKGEKSTGPHLIQLASLEQAYLFQVNAETLSFLQPILNNPHQLKVGFGLKNDAHLFRQRGIEVQSMIDLSRQFSVFGYQHTMGVKNAIGLLYQQHFQKNKKISTSNWNKAKLSSEQIDYAAADAYAALKVFYKLYELRTLPKQLMLQISQLVQNDSFV